MDIKIPEKQPFEGNATQKQKQKIWELGYQDESVIDELGKSQASWLIDELIRISEQLSSKKSSQSKLFISIAAVIFLAAPAFFGESTDQDPQNVLFLFFATLPLPFVAWFGIKTLYYSIKLK